MKFKRSKADIRRRRILAHAMNLKGKAIMKSVGISRKLRKRLKKNSFPGWEEERKKRIDALSEEKVEEVNSFFDEVKTFPMRLVQLESMVIWKHERYWKVPRDRVILDIRKE